MVRAPRQPDFPMPETLLATLSFPAIDPVIFEIGPFAIRWYGLGYVVGILFGWWYSRRLAAMPRLWANNQPAMTPADIDDFLIWAAIGIVLGGRIGYVLFYDLPRYLAEPWAVFSVWEGGMSFHGGLIGTILAMIVFSRRRGINTWSLFDVIGAGVPVGLGLVRCANFINSELWGRMTDMPWGVVFPNGGPFPRHPSQLYEAFLEGAVLFAVLAWLVWARGRLKTPKFVGGAFIAGYGLVRIFVEFFREPDAHIGYLLGGWLTMGMVLSLPMVLVGVWAMATARPAPVPATADDRT
jgi:phosphatidylglycerol:prolipoprotein diacylglycerol transferase